MISFILLLHSNDPIRAIAWCAIGFCAGLYLFFNGFRLLQRRHLILDTPVSKIRSASMGMVELNGQAAGPYTVIAPITERSCYYFRTIVWEWKRQGRNNAWVKVASECTHVPFFLDDNTGKVMVDPRGAELDLHRDFQQEFCDALFTIKEEAPPNVHALL
ncbi:MAG: GIDE domain-containing protein, partial [Candidatus Sulfotelmatobacter sp.]